VVTSFVLRVFQINYSLAFYLKKTFVQTVYMVSFPGWFSSGKFDFSNEVSGLGYQVSEKSS